MRAPKEKQSDASLDVGAWAAFANVFWQAALREMEKQLALKGQTKGKANREETA